MTHKMKLTYLLTLLTLSPLSLYSRGFGSSFGGGFVGGFSGSLIGNAISRPRQQREECTYYQPVQQTRVIKVQQSPRVIEVHKPTYIEVPYNEGPRYQNRCRYHENKQREQRIREIHASDAQTAFLESEGRKTTTQELDKKIQELEAKKQQAELAEIKAKNQALELELKQLKSAHSSR